MKRLAVLLCFVLALSIFSACDKNKETITIVYTNKAESIALTHLAAAITEDEYKYKIETIEVTDSQAFEMLATGEADIFVSARLPNTHGNYIKDYGEQIKSLGIIYENAQNGLVVPSYADIDSIAQLNGATTDIEGKIIGINAEANIMSVTTEVIEEYDLDYELIPNSKEEMFNLLGQAISNQKNIVITGWAPHWQFDQWHLKFLDDPLGIYGEAERIEAYASKDFQKEYPQVAYFLGEYSLNTAQYAGLMNIFRKAESKADLKEVSRSWIFANNGVVDSWL
ncbi:MAG: glycine betaine ABC transporter substrate-binding protein [Clostridia bacterium]|nr:glycine betaine ABC transporter substrate-binding protein [Clostridia bacterium]